MKLKALQILLLCAVAALSTSCGNDENDGAHGSPQAENASPTWVDVRGTESLTDPDMLFVLHLRRSLSPREAADLDKLIDDWYSVGVQGGFGGFEDGGMGVMHNIGRTDASQNREIAWWLDAGSAGHEMFTALSRMLTVANEDSRNQPPAFEHVDVRFGPTDADCQRYPAACG